MTHWLDQIAEELHDRLCTNSLRCLRVVDSCARTIVVDGRKQLNLASNDYLALASHPRLVEAACAAARRWGAGAGSSRLVGGHLECHREVEERFAKFKHAQAALLMPTGYMANLAVLTTLARRGDVILLDKLCHASLIDGARVSGAEVRIFPHRGLDKLERLLKRYGKARRRLIVTDAIFSMDGDLADLPDLCALRDAHGAILIVDEAHATGVLGKTGSGLAEEQGVAGRIDVTVSTGGKALGCLGGIVTAQREVIDAMINQARSFIYTTGLPPMQAAALAAALDVIADEPGRRQRLRDLSARIRSALRENGWTVSPDPTPIVPLVVGDNANAVTLEQRLFSAGVFAPAIRPPTVAPNAARVRLGLRADLTDVDIDRIVDAAGSPCDYYQPA